MKDFLVEMQNDVDYIVENMFENEKLVNDIKDNLQILNSRIYQV